MSLYTTILPRLKWVPVIFAALGAVGCVSQRYVDDLERLYRTSQEQVLDLQARIEEKETEISVLRSTLNNQDPALLDKLQKALASHEKLTSALARAEDNIRAIGSEPILDPALDAALSQLVQSNPGLMSYDAAMGMVKFHSDLTFALGSTEVNPQATASLQALAQILNSSAGSGYIARIVGHTDNVPIGRPETKAKHPTNWHLSVHRAIAVKDLLTRTGVDPSRMSVAGYGEHRPIAPNSAKGNDLNRRVEIYLVRPQPGDNFASPTGDVPNAPGLMGGKPTTGQTADVPSGMFK